MRRDLTTSPAGGVDPLARRQLVSAETRSGAAWRVCCALLLATALLASGCGKADSKAPPRAAPRPVEVYVLDTIDPSVPLQITGSVSSWKEQDVGFEVGGRVRYVQEQGTQLEGRWEEGGEVLVEGQVLAELDERPYRIAVSQAESAVLVAREKIGVAQAEIDQVLPANLRAAIAEEENAKNEYERYKEAGKTNAVSVLDVARAKTDVEVRSAKVAQTKAVFATREAEKRSLEAGLEQAKAQLEDARWQLGNCRLHAPFTGEVSRVFVEAGGFAQPGMPIAHLTMMDPIQVDVAVSADTLGALQRYETVSLLLPGITEPVTGRIYDLATVADPKTRTFRVSVIVRNRRGTGNENPEDPRAGLQRVSRLLIPLKADLADPEGRWYVESRRSLRQDQDGWFVWTSTTPLNSENLSADQAVFTAKKVRVTPGEKRLNYQGIYVLRELTDAGTLDKDTFLPLDLPADFPDGGEVLYDGGGWLLRPGQIVSIQLSDKRVEPGLFVPMSVVLPDGEGTGRIFLVDQDRARPVRIDTTRRAGPLVRVRALDAAEAPLLGPGAKVIRQSHFIHDGEAVRIVRTHEVRP